MSDALNALSYAYNNCVIADTFSLSQAMKQETTGNDYDHSRIL